MDSVRTVDSIRQIRALVESIVSDERIVMTVSFDTVNAFNTLPWNRVVEALEMSTMIEL